MADEFTRDLIAEACRLDDETRADFEIWESQRAQSQPQELVRKTYSPPPQQQQSVDTTAAWNKWFSESFRSHIKKYNEDLVEDLTEAMAYTISEVRAEWRKEIADEIEKKMRADPKHDTGVLASWPPRKKHVA